MREGIDRTEEGLCEKLLQSEYPEDVIEKAVAYVLSFGYINDASYAENYILSRRDSKSRRELEALLAKKEYPEKILTRRFQSAIQRRKNRKPYKKFFVKNGSIQRLRKCTNCGKYTYILPGKAFGMMQSVK